MRRYKTDNVRKHGAIDLETLQKYINFHFSVSLDLFGSERSTNAANYFTQGLKGRYQESRIKDDHQLQESLYPVLENRSGKIIEVQVPALLTINEKLRDDYVIDCQRGVDRWNKLIADAGIEFKIELPHKAFNRSIGSFSSSSVSPDGVIISEESWKERADKWLPTASDHEFVQSLMTQVTDTGEYAGWIAPPRLGINKQGLDYPYVVMQ